MAEVHDLFDENNSLHCLNGPAIIRPGGYKGWYRHGKRHRLDGPALIHGNGSQAWYLNGVLHRLDGPAVIYANGREEWWINDDEITAEVVDWIKENSYPHWGKWDAAIRTYFALRFRS